MVALKVDPARVKAKSEAHGAYFTGILVRARLETGSHAAVDIELLDRESLIRWLSESDGSTLEEREHSRRAINTCLHLMGHKMLDPQEKLP